VSFLRCVQLAGPAWHQARGGTTCLVFLGWAATTKRQDLLPGPYGARNINPKSSPEMLEAAVADAVRELSELTGVPLEARISWARSSALDSGLIVVPLAICEYGDFDDESGYSSLGRGWGRWHEGGLIPFVLMSCRSKSNRARTFGSRRLPVIGASEAPSETHPAVDHPGENIEAAWNEWKRWDVRQKSPIKTTASFQDFKMKIEHHSNALLQG
jgi:hypothetical protein